MLGITFFLSLVTESVLAITADIVGKLECPGNPSSGQARGG